MTAIQPTVPDGPLFWTVVRGFTHVGRYRRHYAIAALWAMAMVLIPTWSGDLIDTTTAAPVIIKNCFIRYRLLTISEFVEPGVGSGVNAGCFYSNSRAESMEKPRIVKHEWIEKT